MNKKYGDTFEGSTLELSSYRQLFSRRKVVYGEKFPLEPQTMAIYNNIRL